MKEYIETINNMLGDKASLNISGFSNELTLSLIINDNKKILQAKRTESEIINFLDGFYTALELIK